MTPHRNPSTLPRTRGALVLATAIVVFSLGACASNPYGWSGEARERVTGEMDAVRSAPSVPADVSEGLLSPLEVRLPNGEMDPVEARFDLSVNNASVRQVLMNLVEGTPYSMVLHPDVSGNVSLQLKEVTVPEAMRALRQVYGYYYRREGNRFYVLGRGMQTRVFPVNYLNLSRRGKSDTRVASGELTQSTTGSSAAAANAGATSTSTARIPGVQVQTESHADFWKDLKDTLTSLVGTAGGRSVAVNPQTNLVIVRAMPDELLAVEEFLGHSHAVVGRQVILEAKVINVQLNDGFQTGINWAKLHGSYLFGQTGGGTIFNRGTSEIAGNGGNLNPATGVLPSGTSTSAFGGVFTISARTNDFAAFLELLETQGNVHVLSSPRVSTINNQKAVIKVGGEEFFITGVTNNVTTIGTSAVLTPEVQLTPFFSGIALDVTPQIDDRGNITLHIHPSVSEVKQRDKSFVVSDQAFNLPLAASTIQESDNVVRAGSGQIIVIGGLMREGVTDENASIPLLGDIPIVGNLFKHKRVTRIKNELVILLKPTVVEGQAWNDYVEDANERIRKMKR
ncbi:MAG: pilus (MSHA type) biogenesis protein MshL [Gammaproteobacteria bacterium]